MKPREKLILFSLLHVFHMFYICFYGQHIIHYYIGVFLLRLGQIPCGTMVCFFACQCITRSFPLLILQEHINTFLWVLCRFTVGIHSSHSSHSTTMVLPLKPGKHFVVERFYFVVFSADTNFLLSLKWKYIWVDEQFIQRLSQGIFEGYFRGV